GRALAEALNLPFLDLDAEIESREGMPIPQIFAARGESGFRQAERAALAAVCRDPQERVVALGGGALLDERNRTLAEAHGTVLLLHASLETLAARLAEDANVRPLVEGGQRTMDDRPRMADGARQATEEPPERQRLAHLLAMRKAHYDSFPLRLESDAPLAELVWRAQAALGRFRVTGMGAPYAVRVQAGGLDSLGEHLTRLGLRGPVALVTDENVGALYARRALESLQSRGFPAQAVVIPAGEAHKTLETVTRLWEAFLRIGVERGSTVVALGGGVVGDLTGFAAATFLRGVPWVNVPTSLLAMVDASLGGKTGADLPQGKNLIGAFHAPRLVLADPETLSTLPEAEMRNGMAEVIKHGVIGDPALFEIARQGRLP
ncbi:MAG: iron-containing alcohol dehydrogenase, partial [Anaerolineae bacterium]